MTKKHIIPIIFTLFFVVITGCSKIEQNYQINNHITNDQQAIKDNEERNNNTSNQKDNIGPDILETDIDTSDWLEYKSDKFDYSFKLPPDFIFVDEYYGKEIGYNPNNNYFLLESIKNPSKPIMSIAIIIKDINDYIGEYDIETGLYDGILKSFSINSVDYYKKNQRGQLFPNILYKDSLIIEIGCNSGMNPDSCKAIIKSTAINNAIDYCTAEPTFADNGAKINPINKEKYKSKEFVHIGFLGELFTADDCGISRVNDLFGTDYQDGLKIWVSSDISKDFIVTLREIGFTCSDDNVLDDRCKEWQIEKDVVVSNLLSLKPFYQYIQLSDCINCG